MLESFMYIILFMQYSNIICHYENCHYIKHCLFHVVEMQFILTSCLQPLHGESCFTKGMLSFISFICLTVYISLHQVSFVGEHLICNSGVPGSILMWDEISL